MFVPGHSGVSANEYLDFVAKAHIDDEPDELIDMAWLRAMCAHGPAYTQGGGRTVRGCACGRCIRRHTDVQR
eukprot:7078635-Prymnesium_polylepis.1